ncbi:MAG: V-type ATPase subunit, partial [bacterium]
DTPLLHEKIRYDLPVSDILQSENIHQLVEKLEETPYQSILVNRLSQYDKMKTVFPFEVALDKDYYSRLWNLTDSFDKRDREISKKILGLEIDLINLAWLTRYKNFYDVSSESLSTYLIPKGNDNNISFIQSIDKAESAPKIVEKIVGTNRIKQLGGLDNTNNIAFFEKETKNLFSIIQSKVYELNENEVLPYLVF